jgi:hypothetical protein
MRKIAFILCITALFLISCSDDSTTTPQSTAINGLYFTPDEVTVAVGQPIELNLKIGSLADSIFAASLQIGFSDAVVSFADSAGFVPGDFFGDQAVGFAQDSTSILHLSITRTQGQSQVIGSGSLGTLHFNARAAGTTSVQIAIDQLHFYNASGSEITVPDIEIHSATLHVQ